MTISVTIPETIVDEFRQLASRYGQVANRKQVTHRLASLFAESRDDYLSDGTETSLVDIACVVPEDIDSPYPYKARTLNADINGTRVKSRSSFLTAICPAFDGLPKSVLTNILTYNRVYTLFSVDEVPMNKVVCGIYSVARDHDLPISRVVELSRTCDPVTLDSIRAAAECEAEAAAKAIEDRDDITRKASLGSGLMAHGIAPMYKTWVEHHSAKGVVEAVGDSAEGAADDTTKTRGPEGRVVDDLVTILRPAGELADLSPEAVPKLFRRDDNGKFRRVRDRVSPMKVAALVAADPIDKWITYKVIVPSGEETYLRTGIELCSDMRAAAAVLAFYNEAGDRADLPAMHTLFGESIFEDRVWTLLGSGDIGVVMPVFDPECLPIIEQ